MATTKIDVYDFVCESNRIEGINRPPTEGEIAAHQRFLCLSDVTVRDLEDFVGAVARAVLRNRPGMDVRVGAHVPPRGGPGIESELMTLLCNVNDDQLGAHEAHVRYELPHPFMDGNGRSGRVLWAWMMRQKGCDPFALPFLHRFYYQALDAARA